MTTKAMEFLVLSPRFGTWRKLLAKALASARASSIDGSTWRLGRALGAQADTAGAGRQAALSR